MTILYTFTRLILFLRPLAFVSIGFCLAGCTATHTTQTLHKWKQDTGLASDVSQARHQYWALPKHSHIQIITDAPLVNVKVVGATDNLIHYGRLNRLFTETLKTQLSPHFDSVTFAPKTDARIRPSSIDFIMQLTLLSVEDNFSSLQERQANHGMMSSYSRARSTSRSGKGRDRLQVALSIFDARTGNKLDTVFVRSWSGWPQLYTHSPHDLVDGIVTQLVQNFSAPSFTYSGK